VYTVRLIAFKSDFDLSVLAFYRRRSVTIIARGIRNRQLIRQTRTYRNAERPTCSKHFSSRLIVNNRITIVTAFYPRLVGGRKLDLKFHDIPTVTSKTRFADYRRPKFEIGFRRLVSQPALPRRYIQPEPIST